MKKVVPVSVVIPTCNRQTLLDRALRSVVAQTVRPQEVIVVDDGSTDDTHAMLKANYPHVKYCFQDNLGVSKARNTGISVANSPWIAFLDSDDEWLPDKLQKQFETLQNNAGVLLCHTEEIWIRHGKRVNPMNKHQKYGGYIYDKCLPLCAISPSSVIIHQRLFEQVGLFDESLPACEDYDLWLRICNQYEVLFIDSPLIVKYGGHDDQLSRRHWGMDRFRIQALLKMLNEKTLTENNYHLTLEALKAKCAIYIQGAIKRGKQAEAAYYQQLIDRFSSPHAEQR
ncbi:MAG: glycosyltransferase family 2 protein [Gammaproteobacteria bacterium]|nr:glycosyltransferase family 2 protein [Gammaproteobacteria bacterium]